MLVIQNKEYITIAEATELLDVSKYAISKAISGGKLTAIEDPTGTVKKLILYDDVKEHLQENERDFVVKLLRLDLVDAVAPYEVPTRELLYYENEIQELSKLDPEDRREPFRALVKRVVAEYKERVREAGANG